MTSYRAWVLLLAVVLVSCSERGDNSELLTIHEQSLTLYQQRSSNDYTNLQFSEEHIATARSADVPTDTSEGAEVVDLGSRRDDYSALIPLKGIFIKCSEIGLSNKTENTFFELWDLVNADVKSTAEVVDLDQTELKKEMILLSLKSSLYPSPESQIISGSLSDLGCFLMLPQDDGYQLWFRGEDVSFVASINIRPNGNISQDLVAECVAQAYVKFAISRFKMGGRFGVRNLESDFKWGCFRKRFSGQVTGIPNFV